MEDLTILKILIAALIGFSSKIIWDWLKSGRVNKSECMTRNIHKEICCLPTLEPDVSNLKSVSTQHERRLTKLENDFQSMKDDISSIKQSIARIEATMQAIANRRD